MNLITSDHPGSIKKYFITLLAALLAAFFACPVNAFTFENPASKRGDFTLRSVTPFESYDSIVYVYEHDRTGAKVMYIKNDDPDRYFMLEFETPSSSDKGTAHVFEHSAMNGSVKYPSRSLASAVRSRSYVSFMNAFTKDACTIYPIASMSEAQLLKFADYYSDLCFEPLILEDEDIFRSEGWRLSLDDPDGEITVNGTIYSEMKGSYTPQMEASKKAMGLLYGDCSASYVAGGIPEDILTLSYDEVKSFHGMYYIPSNCTAYLYGDIGNLDAFLDLLDGYFDRFDKKGVSPQKREDSAYSGYTERRFGFPSSEENNAPNASEMVFAIDLDRPSDDELEEMYAFAKCCNLEYSTPQLALRSLFPGSDFGFSVICDDGDAAFVVSASGMQEDEAPYLRRAVAEILYAMYTDGLGEDELDYFRKRMESDAVLATEGGESTINLLASIANYNSVGRGELFYVKMRDRMSDMGWFANDVVKRSCARILIPEEKSAMSIVTPDRELYEENSRVLSNSLKKITGNMSAADRKKLVADTKRIVEKASDDPTEYLDELSAVSLHDLPDETAKPEVSDTTDDKDVRHITVYTDENHADAARIYLDASYVPEDMLGYLALYVDLVNGSFVPASDHERGDIPYLVSKCTGSGQEISLIVSSSGEDYTPYVTVDFISSPDTLADAFDMAYERLFESSFDDAAMIEDGILSVMSAVGSTISSNPELLACYTGAAGANGIGYYERTHYIEYYDFLKKLSEEIGNDDGTVAAKLREAAGYINAADGAVIAFAAGKKEEKNCSECADDFTARLGKRKGKRAEYESTGYDSPLGIVIPGMVGSNALAVSDAGLLGLDGDHASDAVALSLMVDAYIKPLTRNAYGAYSSAYMDRYPAVAVFTGKDPNTIRTFEVFSNMGSAWKEIRGSMSQEDLEDYVITLYSKESQSAGVIGDALTVVSDMVAGRGSDVKSRTLSELKSIKLSDLEKYDGFFESFANEGKKVSAAPLKLLDEHKDDYVRILDPFAN